MLTILLKSLLVHKQVYILINLEQTHYINLITEPRIICYDTRIGTKVAKLQFSLKNILNNGDRFCRILSNIKMLVNVRGSFHKEIAEE